MEPGVGAVAAAVVGQDPFDGDSAIGEPRDGAFQGADCGGGLLVRADLDVGKSGVVVDDGMQERGPGPGLSSLPLAKPGVANVLAAPC